MNKPLPPFKWFALQNFPFIEYDFDAITNYELMCKIVEYVKEIALKTNTLGAEVENLINWFNNLDVQDEVDNKLDEMAEDGTLAEIINEEIFNELNSIVQSDTLTLNDECKIYFPYRGENTGDCSIIQNSNKTIIIDVGVNGNALISWLVAKQITKIDYIIISHYHNDHVGGENASGLIDLLDSSAIDTSDCVFYLPHKGIDWSQIIAAEKAGIMANESAIKNAITSKGLTYIEPDNLDELVLNSICKLKFMNIGSTYYVGYYGLTHNEYNNFSMVVELQHNNRFALFTGDIVEQAQSNMASIINQPDVLKAPHHDLEPQSSAPFLKKMTCKVMMFFEWFSYAGDGLFTELSQAVKNNQGNIYDTNNSQDVLIIFKNDNIIENSTNGVFSLNNISLLTAAGIHLTENTDLNDLREQGTYYTNTYTETSTLLHSPEKVIETEIGANYLMGRCRVVNESMNMDNSIMIQRFITGINSYYRVYNDNGWTDWTIESGDNVLNISAKYIPADGDLNDYTKAGKYIIINNDKFDSIANIPEEGQGGSTLLVFELRVLYDIRQQMLICASGNIYLRQASMNQYNTEVTTWTDWKKVAFTTIE